MQLCFPVPDSLILMCICRLAPNTPERAATHMHAGKHAPSRPMIRYPSEGERPFPWKWPPRVFAQLTHTDTQIQTCERTGTLGPHQRSWANPQMSTTMGRKRRREEAFIYLYLSVVQVHAIHGELLSIF